MGRYQPQSVSNPHDSRFSTITWTNPSPFTSAPPSQRNSALSSQQALSGSARSSALLNQALSARSSAYINSGLNQCLDSDQDAYGDDNRDQNGYQKKNCSQNRHQDDSQNRNQYQNHQNQNQNQNHSQYQHQIPTQNHSHPSTPSPDGSEPSPHIPLPPLAHLWLFELPSPPPPTDNSLPPLPKKCPFVLFANDLSSPVIEQDNCYHGEAWAFDTRGGHYYPDYRVKHVDENWKVGKVPREWVGRGGRLCRWVKGFGKYWVRDEDGCSLVYATPNFLHFMRDMESSNLPPSPTSSQQDHSTNNSLKIHRKNMGHDAASVFKQCHWEDYIGFRWIYGPKTPLEIVFLYQKFQKLIKDKKEVEKRIEMIGGWDEEEEEEWMMEFGDEEMLWGPGGPEEPSEEMWMMMREGREIGRNGKGGVDGEDMEGMAECYAAVRKWTDRMWVRYGRVREKENMEKRWREEEERIREWRKSAGRWGGGGGGGSEGGRERRRDREEHDGRLGGKEPEYFGPPKENLEPEIDSHERDRHEKKQKGRKGFW